MSPAGPINLPGMQGLFFIFVHQGGVTNDVSEHAYSASWRIPAGKHDSSELTFLAYIVRKRSLAVKYFINYSQYTKIKLVVQNDYFKSE
jgi:hypothetical protein